MAKNTCTTEVQPFEECSPENGNNSNGDNGNNGGNNGNSCFDGICVEVRDGQLCPVDNFRSPWSLTENSEDSCLTDSYINEQLNIGGADLNVHKLLGIHEQGKLLDLTGDGDAITSGAHPNFPAKNAFDLFKTEWRSLELGPDIIAKSYLGYDFGEIKLTNGRLRYGIETFVKHNINTVRIKQGCDSKNRVTKIRLERSHDGERWFGVGIANVRDCDGLVVLNFTNSVPSRYWRIRPIEFNGDAKDYWSIQSLQFLDYEKTDVHTIQDKILMENRDRDYAEVPIKLKGSYQPFDSQSFFAQAGLSMGAGGEQYIIELSWTAVIALLGRPIVIGDIIQLPSETQYGVDLIPVLKYLTVTDVGWSPNGYSPQWIPLMVRVIAVPTFASPETQDIMGNLTETYDENGLANVGDGQNNKKYSDIADIDHTIRAEANTEVPVRGEDAANVAKLSDEVYEWEDNLPEGTQSDISKIDRARNVWSQDGLPPNGEPYTQADDFPKNPKDGDWHRLTYTNIRQGIPPRLYKYSADKGNWIYLETDRRAYASVIRPRLQDFEDPEQSTVTKPDEIDEDFTDLS